MAKKTEKIERFCAFCEYGTRVPGEHPEDDRVICPKKGLMQPDGVCRRFRYDPLKREPKPKRALPAFEAIDLDE